MTNLKTNKMTTKRINIISFHTKDNEVYFTGSDEVGKDIQIVFDSLELLEYIDINHIGSSINKYIETLQ